MWMKNKPITILELYKEANGQPLFGHPSYSFMIEYNQHPEKYDRIFSRTRKSFCPIWNLDDEDDIAGVLSSFRSDVEVLIAKNKLKYEKLWELTLLEYNPIENYKMVEHGTDKHTGTEDTDTFLGAQQNTSSYGAATNTSQYGSSTDMVAFGAEHSETKSDVSAFNSGSYENDNKSTTDNNAHTNTTTNGERNDTFTNGAHSDTMSIGGRDDSEVKTYDTTDTHDFTRSGNIGVTTTQQMIQSTIDLYDAWDGFYETLFEDIIEELCCLFDDGVEAFGFVF